MLPLQGSGIQSLGRELRSHKQHDVIKKKILLIKLKKNFLGGPVVKNPPTHARAVGLIPALGRLHMPRGSKHPVHHDC